MALPPKEATLIEQRVCRDCSWMIIMKPTLQSFVTPVNRTMAIAGGCPRCDGNMNRKTIFTQDIKFEIHRGVTQELWCRRNENRCPSQKSRILENNKLELQAEFLL